MDEKKPTRYSKDEEHKDAAIEAEPPTTNDAVTPEPSEREQLKKKKSRRRPLIFVGVIVVVLVAAGAGLWGWHEQPSFCSAICHSPMDPYVDGYFSDDMSLAVVAHRTDDVTCLECHDSSIGEQISEATAWLSGNFSDPLTLRRFGTVEFCGRCHDDGDETTGKDWEDIIATTAHYQNSGRNPHDSHLGAIDCYTCHSMHSKSKLYCTQCHDNIKVPDSWK